MITELKWKTLTAAVNSIKSPNQFIKKLLYSNHITLSTEDIELSVISRGREIAPFVRKNSEAIMVGGYTSKNQTVSAPNIRIKKPFTPSELLFNRQPGTTVYIDGASQVNALQAHIARDLQGLSDMITNAEEYLCAMSLQGALSYSVADQEVFTITFPKPSGHNITPLIYWNAADLATVPFHDHIHAIKRLISEEVGLSVTDCIMGTEASDAFRTLLAGGYIKGLTTTSGITVGDATFCEQFAEDGSIYLGRIDGIRFWEYGRTANLGGVATPMIRSKYCEFVATSPAAERILYYGAIADMKALEGRKFQGERFSKSWEKEDPSALMCLLSSRPLPCPRKPGASVSLKAVSG